MSDRALRVWIILAAAVFAIGQAAGTAGSPQDPYATLMHFWDDTDFRDPASVESQGIVSQRFARYACLLGQADSVIARQSVRRLLDTASADPAVYRGLLDIAEGYLYDPSSATVDEEIFLPFLQCALADTVIYPEDRMRMEQWLTQIYRNRRGTPAADFQYIGRDGAVHTLYTTAPDAPQRLLLFYDPDCPHCLDAIAAIEANTAVAAAVADGTMALIAIYADGDTDIWERNIDQLPAPWIVGYTPDGALENDEIYDLRSMPTIYLLSGNTVRSKDIHPSKIPHLKPVN